MFDFLFLFSAPNTHRCEIFDFGHPFFSPPLQGKGWVGMVFFSLAFCAARGPTHVPVSLTGHPGRRVTFSCLCKRKYPKRTHPRCRAGAKAPVRYGRPGFCRQSIHGLRQKRRDPSRRPARCAGLVRPPFAASQRDPRSRAKTLRCFASAAGTAALLFCSRVPLGRGKGAQEKARRGARRMRARSLPVHGRTVSEPP